jgi:GT2 family glycosyltransferase
MGAEPVTPNSGNMTAREIGPSAQMLRRRLCQHFRPWYEDAAVTDLNPGDGFCLDYTSRFGSSGSHGGSPSRNDVVLAFGCLNDAVGIGKLEELTMGEETLVIASLEAEASPQTDSDEFRANAEALAQGKTVRFLHQSADWPFSVSEGLGENAVCWIATIGDAELPSWPRIGIAMPTAGNSEGAALASLSLIQSYPGELVVALVANGVQGPALDALRELQEAHPAHLRLVELEENTGFGQGSNRGLLELSNEGNLDFYGVANDDVVPAFDCVCEMAEAMRQLSALGYKPGMIGPVSNNVNGSQQVDIGPYSDVETMLALSSDYHRAHVSSATPAPQVRGLFLLISPECLETIGGFDPRFGIGNFEDDDDNLRAKLAGFTTWIADGAFLHHEGSKTFKGLGVDYRANIERNAQAFLAKWNLEDLARWPEIQEPPTGVELHVPLGSNPWESRHTMRLNGETVDLVDQATDIEFAAWVMNSLSEKPRESRKAVIEAIRAA